MQAKEDHHLLRILVGGVDEVLWLLTRSRVSPDVLSVDHQDKSRPHQRRPCFPVAGHLNHKLSAQMPAFGLGLLPSSQTFYFMWQCSLSQLLVLRHPHQRQPPSAPNHQEERGPDALLAMLRF